MISSFIPALAILTRSVIGETWLSSHSFAEPLSASLKNDWLVGGAGWPDVNGLSLTNEKATDAGWIASKAPLLTNTFQVMMAVSVSTDQTHKAGDIVKGDPGMMMFFHDKENRQWPPNEGTFYGLDPSIDGHGVFFALTSREDKVSPSISFGAKGSEVLKTPLPRGIYWNYLDKNEFEVMLDVQQGKEIHGYIRSKSSDRWTQAFSESMPEEMAIKANSHFILSASNGEMAVRYTISRVSVTSQDDNQPGYQKEVERVTLPQQDENKEETIADMRVALIQLTELFATEFSRSYHFYDEQRNANKLIIGLLEQIKGSIPNVSADSKSNFEEHITQITSKMESMEKSLAAARRPDRKIDDSISRVESMFHSISRSNESSLHNKNNIMYFMFAILAIVAGGMGYVIMHMKKLEKKHLL